MYEMPTNLCIDSGLTNAYWHLHCQGMGVDQASYKYAADHSRLSGRHRTPNCDEVGYVPIAALATSSRCTASYNFPTLHSIMSCPLEALNPSGVLTCSFTSENHGQCMERFISPISASGLPKCAANHRTPQDCQDNPPSSQAN